MSTRRAKGRRLVNWMLLENGVISVVLRVSYLLVEAIMITGRAEGQSW